MSLLIIEKGQIVGSLSTVPIVSLQNKTAERNFGVVYTNTSGKTLFVNVNVRIDIKNAGDFVSLAVVTTAGTQMLVGLNPAPAVMTDFRMIPFQVPPNHTYRINKTKTASATEAYIQYWYESY